jgi:hypothetical protein
VVVVVVIFFFFIIVAIVIRLVVCRVLVLGITFEDVQKSLQFLIDRLFGRVLETLYCFKV